MKKGDLGGFVEKEENLSHKGNCWIADNACVYDNACIFDDAQVYGNARVCGSVCIYNHISICKDAYIKLNDDICFISLFGSHNRHTTFFRCKDNTIKVSCGCFEGTLDEFRDKVKETHGNNKYAKEYLTITDAIEIKFLEL